MATTAQLVARYAGTFNARYATRHAVTSPLGAWLLLAVAAAATTGDARRRLGDVLGCDAAEASSRAASLLATTHPAVSCAAAIWAHEQFLTERFAAFRTAVPPQVEQGPMPTKAAADRWAVEHTKGMIDSFPVAIDELSALVLATAVATDVSWTTPFTAVPATELGGELGATVRTVLRADADHRQLIATTDAAGDVAVHVASARSGLDVISVLAAASTSPAEVHAAAHEVAAMLAGDDSSTATRRSLFDLPLGDGVAWTIAETDEVRMSGPSRVETFATWMPAWSAQSTHDVIAASGFPELCAAFGDLLRPDLAPASFAARQSAVASYTRVGFRAAAVTAFGMRAGAMPHETKVVRRHAEVRFERPYAVVAIATERTIDDENRYERIDVGGWAGLPVFSAWVARADEA